MKITVFLEGSPGHEKQSLAVIKALQRLVDVDVEQIGLEKVHVVERAWEVCRLFFLADGGCKYPLHNTDLLIGTGSRTHAPLLACKKKYNIPVVTCMTPDIYLRSMFDLCIVPRHDGIDVEKNVFLTAGPPVLPVPKLPRDNNAGLILLGGEDLRSHEWNTSEVASYIRKIVTDYPEMQWTISSSPRTPEETVQELLGIEEAAANVTFFRFQDTPDGWVEEQYARSTIVWVTADSMSMIYEAITAGCKVGVFPVKWRKCDNKFQSSLDYLFDKGYAIQFNAFEKHSMESLGQVSFDEAERCAHEIVARFSQRQWHQ